MKEIEAINALLEEGFFQHIEKTKDEYIFHDKEGVYRVGVVQFRMMLDVTVSNYQPNWVDGLETKAEYLNYRIRSL